MHIKIVNGNTKVNQDAAYKSYNDQGSGNSKLIQTCLAFYPTKR